MNALFKSPDDYLILQYGSSLFGSETKESDYDIIIVTTLNTLRQYMNARDGYIKPWEPEAIRMSFFFGDVLSKLSKDHPLNVLKIYDVTSAKVPIIKVKFKDSLSLDMSLGIVSNESLIGIPLGALNAVDEQTESVL